MASRHYDFIPSVPYHDADGNWQSGVDGYVEIDARWQIASFNVTVQTEAETLLHLADRIVRWLGEQEILLWMTVLSSGSRGENGTLFTNIAMSEGIADYTPVLGASWRICEMREIALSSNESYCSCQL